MKESVFQQTLCSYLSAQHIFYFAPLNETAMMILKMFKVPKVIAIKIMAFLKKMGLIPGMPDIIILANRTVYFLELKVGDNTTSEQQNIIHRKIYNDGYQVATVYTLEEAIGYLKAWGVVR